MPMANYFSRSLLRPQFNLPEALFSSRCASCISLSVLAFPEDIFYQRDLVTTATNQSQRLSIQMLQQLKMIASNTD